jgi:hypothetical protein
MQQQMITLDYAKRKRLYDRVQQLTSENSGTEHPRKVALPI